MDFDVIMVVRGGGDEESFAVFNDKVVCEAVYKSEIPIIFGIGHTKNYTLADQIADRSETTPTKAAHFLVSALGKPRYRQYYNEQNRETYKQKEHQQRRKGWNKPLSPEISAFLKFIIGAILVLCLLLLFK